MVLDPRGLLLRHVIDHTLVHDYGDGILVDLPITYSDGDAVRLLVEPINTGLRVTDRGYAIGELLANGVNPDIGRAARAIEAARMAADLNGVANPDKSELSTFGEEPNLGEMLLSVAGAALRVEQLRWLATDQPEIRFNERVLQRLRPSKQWTTVSAELGLRDGRARRVTAAVQGTRGKAFVQALSLSRVDSAVEHCFFLFAQAEVESNRLVAALEGTREQWPGADARALAGVGRVAFFEEPGDLESQLQQVVAGGAQLSPA